MNLSKIRLSSKSSGLDRFGFFYWLKKKLNIPSFYTSRCDWEHGWQFQEFYCESLVYYKYWLNRNLSQVVSSYKKKELLESFGQNKIYVAPYPFYFFYNGFLKVNEFFPKKNDTKNKLLVIPNKIQPFSNLNNEKKRIFKYLDYIIDNKKNFESIFISIPPDEKNNDVWVEVEKKFNFNFIEGISPYDLNAYYRTIKLFNNFEYITSDCLGSHVLYSNLMKKKFSICGPINDINRDYKLLNTPYKCPISRKKIIQDFEYSSSIYFLKKFYADFIKSNPKEGTFKYEWAYNQIGENKKITINEIKEILNLNLHGQIKNIINKYFRVKL